MVKSMIISWKENEFLKRDGGDLEAIVRLHIILMLHFIVVSNIRTQAREMR